MTSEHGNTLYTSLHYPHSQSPGLAAVMAGVYCDFQLPRDDWVQCYMLKFFLVFLGKVMFL